MKLKTYIQEKNVVLGTTDEGKSWALKALHPADPLTEVRGIPDHSSIPSVFQNYQWTFNVSNPTPATAGIWSFDLFLFPAPVLCGSIRTIASDGSIQWSPIVNPQVGSPADPWYTKMGYFVNNTEKYRVAYMGITGHQDAAAISNQGMIAACQYPITRARTSITGGANSIWREFDMYPQPPKTWQQIQTLPNAFLGTAKEGVYAPFKLTQTCQKWQTAKDTHVWCCYANSFPLGPTTGSTTLFGPPSTTDMTSVWPYGLQGMFAGAAADSFCHNKWSDEGIIHIATNNLHTSGAFTFIMRSGFELQVSPGSALSTFAKISPRLDQLAIDGYFAIVREFKDAYPEEFNSLESILKVIANGASAAISTLFPAAAPVVNAVRSFLKLDKPDSEKPVTQLSEAAKERAQKAVSLAGASADAKQAEQTRAVLAGAIPIRVIKHRVPTNPPPAPPTRRLRINRRK